MKYIPVVLFSLLFLAFSVSSAKSQSKKILFFGDSVTAGYQLDPADAFPAKIQDKIIEEGLSYEVINGGLSGETSAGGLRRINWMLRSPIDIFVLELGPNDGLRGLSLDETKQNLQGIIDKVREKNPDVKIVIAGMQVPPNLGEAYVDEFKNMFPNLAKANDAALIPFLLAGVAGDPKLNLPDRIHPTPEGHTILTENVWAVLFPLL